MSAEVRSTQKQMLLPRQELHARDPSPVIQRDAAAREHDLTAAPLRISDHLPSVFEVNQLSHVLLITLDRAPPNKSCGRLPPSDFQTDVEVEPNADARPRGAVLAVGGSAIATYG